MANPRKPTRHSDRRAVRQHRVVLARKVVRVPIEIISMPSEKKEGFLVRCFSSVKRWIASVRNRILVAGKAALDAIIAVGQEVVFWLKRIAGAAGTVVMSVVLSIKSALVDLATVAIRRERELEAADQNAESVC